MYDMGCFSVMIAMGLSMHSSDLNCARYIISVSGILCI